MKPFMCDQFACNVVQDRKSLQALSRHNILLRRKSRQFHSSSLPQSQEQDAVSLLFQSRAVNDDNLGENGPARKTVSHMQRSETPSAFHPITDMVQPTMPMQMDGTTRYTTNF